MCGITGYLHFDKNTPAGPSVLKKMTDIISHRGPDGEGVFVHNNLALGHRRLSIIDLKTGNQPMKSLDGNIVIVFNGEIYNYIELREELKLLGHHFFTDSDTEVIIKSYEQWGYECQNKFNGMWGFALWDEKKEELFLSRDRLGEKPLHYTVHDKTFIFGSELKSLTAYGINLIPRYELLQVYLTLTYIPAPDTFYEGIYKLMPGHYITVTKGQVKQYKYWELPQIDEEDMLTDKQEIYNTFETLFKDAVKIRMRSDVPFGAFLSGGLDSSSVVAEMSTFSNHPINTFTIGFKDKSFDESDLAYQISETFKTTHYTGTVMPENFETSLNHAAFHFDEPFGDSSAIPTDQVSRFARKKVKMVLTGDGGDEVLSGYISYTGIKLASIIKKFPFFIRKTSAFIISTLSKIIKGRLRYKFNKIKSVIETSDLKFSDRMATKGASTDLALIKELTKSIKGIVCIEDCIEDKMKACRFKDDFYKLMYFNYVFSLPNDYLVKVDRASMANSLETRLPFLDYRLVEFMAKVNKNVKMHGWERKSVLRNTIGKSLPDSILKAPKRGFGIPLREWFKEKTFSQHLTANLNEVKKVLDSKLIDRLISDNEAGKNDNGNFIWTLLMLNKKLEQLPDNINV